MFERLKRTLVETYIGAIALGYLLARVVLLFATIFSAPFEDLVVHKQWASILPGTPAPTAILQDTLAHLADFLALLLVWYVLFRWLYFNPFQKDEAEPAPNPEQVA